MKKCMQAGHIEQLAREALRQRLPVAEFVGNVDAIGGQQDAAGQGKPNQLIALIAPGLHLMQPKRENAEDNRHVEVEHRVEDPLGLLVRASSSSGLSVVSPVRTSRMGIVEGIEHGGVGPETLGGEGQVNRKGHRVGKGI